MPEHRDSDVKKDDQVVSPAAAGNATLAGMEGRGILSLVYGSEGRLYETQGTWFPSADLTEITELLTAKQEGRTVTYRGPVDIAETAGRDEEIDKQMEHVVRITGVREYKDEEGIERVLVSFEAVDDSGEAMGVREEMFEGSPADAGGGAAVDATGPGGAGTRSADAGGGAAMAERSGTRADTPSVAAGSGAARIYTDPADDQRRTAMTEGTRAGAGRGAATGTPGSDVPAQYTHEEFMALDLRTIAAMTGMEPEGTLDAAGEQEYRQKAWESYELDIEHRDEWGTARQGGPLPEGE